MKTVLKRASYAFLVVMLSLSVTWAQRTNFVEKQMLIFPLQPQHAHGSSIVELPNGDILAAWFQGSGERHANDVVIMGRSEEHTSELQSRENLVCRLLL